MSHLCPPSDTPYVTFPAPSCGANRLTQDSLKKQQPSRRRAPRSVSAGPKGFPAGTRGASAAPFPAGRALSSHLLGLERKTCPDSPACFCPWLSLSPTPASLQVWLSPDGARHPARSWRSLGGPRCRRPSGRTLVVSGAAARQRPLRGAAASPPPQRRASHDDPGGALRPPLSPVPIRRRPFT